ncbi:hypothetical protein SARC_08687 [Sphaeroforma arctica JP610]|uniref:Major facilitator superfamily (MFS) profile domain-containing protein n=1 Tax=Sphaeroforma arctica JP610 TaxID=667725 RepID=A0A0L0FQS7_9EUKA|nr:hypothetical protein SARC_08687 [Sphaeroforma arctica JP610]KNC78901.1 hypothetical protein SARC_08687 [Sphaeroforma arctica JP610]|eukprot:XP_014152803.1 hypothetical protein SARC_08687 [Sphaeroforma arctica JP610]
MIFIMCGVVMGLAEGSNMLIIGRVLLGVGVGICCNSVPLYINNVAPVTLRGSLGTLHQIGVVTGNPETEINKLTATASAFVLGF